MKRGILPVMFLGMLMVALAGCRPAPAPVLSPAPAPSPAKQVVLTVAGGMFGGTLYYWGYGLEDLLKKTNHPWLRAKNIESGTPEMLAHFATKPEELKKEYVALMSAVSLWQAQEGQLTGVEPYKGQRYLAVEAFSSITWATLDKNIKTPLDFPGKRLALYRGGVFEAPPPLILQEYGITEKDVKISRMEYGAAKTALLDGTVDAILVFAWDVGGGKYTLPPFAEELLAQPKPVYFVNIHPEKIEAAMAKAKGCPALPYWVEPKGFGPTQTERICGYTSTIGIFGDKSMAEDVAYELVKVMYENAEKWTAYHAGLGSFLRSNLHKVPGTPDQIHPGALKFYKEKGLKAGL